MSPPTTWFAQLKKIESYAPMMGYLVHSMLSGGELRLALMVQMINNAERYIEDAVRAGTIKPSRDPKARARLLARVTAAVSCSTCTCTTNPTSIEAVLRDYKQRHDPTGSGALHSRAANRRVNGMTPRWPG
jgi:hypothetical protein